nr:MAG TPA: hypothetical protein [Caudoviricetes sp.]
MIILYKIVSNMFRLLYFSNIHSLFHHHHTFSENIIFAYLKTQTSHKKWYSKQAIEKWL